MSSLNMDQRRAGVLLHPTSLPSGKLDHDAERWIDFLADSGFSVWQVLPLGEPQVDLSPYQCSSAFALNPALFTSTSETDINNPDFISFCQKQAFWLDDYALFTVLKKRFDGRSWSDWPEEFRLRQTDAIELAKAQEEQALLTIKWQQFEYDQRWHQIRTYANDRNILLFGDMPIFVGYDSADVWAHEEWFKLDEHGDMPVVTGVPPDYFSETGQRWGNPHYDWQHMEQDHYSWWCSRIDHHLDLFDFIRIDHFRGLEAVWVINADCETAIDGEWLKVPGDQLLSRLRQSLDNCHDHLPFVAEDLGIITEEVTALRKKYALPGMSVLQFGFDGFDDNPHKMKNIEADRVVYTGTHDNDTTKGWFDSLEQDTQQFVLQMLEMNEEHLLYEHGNIADQVVDKMIYNTMSSNGNLGIIPMQDLLHLGNDARMNIPGTVESNWMWKFDWSQTDSVNQSQIKSLLEECNRIN